MAISASSLHEPANDSMSNIAKANIVTFANGITNTPRLTFKLWAPAFQIQWARKNLQHVCHAQMNYLLILRLNNVFNMANLAAVINRLYL